MAKIYCANTVDGRKYYGCQFVNLKSGRYGVLPVQPYRTNRIVRLRCAALAELGSRVASVSCGCEGTVGKIEKSMLVDINDY